MRLFLASLTAMTASMVGLGLMFVYALYVPTMPPVSAEIVRQPAMAWTSPGEPRVLASSDLR